MKPEQVQKASEVLEAIENAGIPVYSIEFTQEGFLIDLGDGHVVGPKVIDSGEKSIEKQVIDSGEKQ